MALAVLSAFLAAPAAPWLGRRGRGWAECGLALLPATLFVYFLGLALGLRDTPIVQSAYAWVPSLNLEFALRADGLSLTFALLITGIGALVFAYAGAYMRGYQQAGRFYVYLYLFMGSMLGVVLSDNLVVLFVFWELTSLTSYLLIGYNHEQESARGAALQALLVTGLGGLAMMAGLILLGEAAGTYSITALLETPGTIRNHPHYAAIVMLLLLGAFTKSAQFPFHFWLPNAMAAPTPASAYLHSSTMVKAGLYLVARFSPVLGGTALWTGTVCGVAGATLVVSGWLAMRETRLKPMLAYTTVAALGLIMLALGLGTPVAIKAAKVFLVVHALYKAALFMTAGSLTHETGESDVTRMGGLRRAMPWTAAGAGLAALSMAGLPPLFGFIGKEAVYEAMLYAPAYVAAAVLVAVWANVANVYVAIAVGWRPFFARRPGGESAVQEAPMGMVAGPMLLGAAGLIIGLFPYALGRRLLEPGGAVVLGEPMDVALKLWHGINTALILSIVTLVLGVGAYALRDRMHRLQEWGPLRLAVDHGPARWYDQAIAGLVVLAKWQTRAIQTGYLRGYLFYMLMTLVFLAGYALFVRRDAVIPELNWAARPHEWALSLVIAVAVLSAAAARTPMTAVIALSVIGYGIAMIYVFYSAPDLAMTQIVVETLTVLLFVMVLWKLPLGKPRTPWTVRLRDKAIAAGAGVFMSAVLLATWQIDHPRPVSTYYAENSLTEAYGRNIVNVILVDFRALDTLGEITVLGIAALGALALLGPGRTAKDKE